MITRKTTVALAVAMALSLPMAASARGLDFNYLEANYINVDVDFSDSFTDEDGTFSLATDDGDGFQIGGAWHVWEAVHLFGEYSTASQDIAVSDGILTAEGDFDVVRWRLGVGNSFPVSDVMSMYGRISYDRIEFKDFKAEGESLGSEADTKDDGFGAELGLLWAATPQFHVQPYVRYTSVGEIDPEKNDTFDADVLFGIGARWFVTENFALQAGFETGEIETWNVGGRFAF